MAVPKQPCSCHSKCGKQNPSRVCRGVKSSRRCAHLQVLDLGVAGRHSRAPGLQISAAAPQGRLRARQLPLAARAGDASADLRLAPCTHVSFHGLRHSLSYNPFECGNFPGDMQTRSLSSQILRCTFGRVMLEGAKLVSYVRGGVPRP